MMWSLPEFEVFSHIMGQKPSESFHFKQAYDVFNRVVDVCSDRSKHMEKRKMRNRWERNKSEQRPFEFFESRPQAVSSVQTSKDTTKR